MKYVKCLLLCLMALSLGMASCNKNENTPVYIPLPVIKTFNPAFKEIYISENQSLAPYREYVCVVNSLSQLPEDEIFGNDEFLDQDIDFSKYSLIIFYDLEFGKIVSTKYRWVYATDFEQYEVAVSYEIEKDSHLVDGEIELGTYIRGAMLVYHIPNQPFVGQNIGIHWVDPN